MGAAGCDNGARGTNSLGCVFAIPSSRAALAIWMEEHFGRKFAAGTTLLPLPNGGNGFWEAGYLGHERTLQPLHRLFKPLVLTLRELAGMPVSGGGNGLTPRRLAREHQ